MVPREERAGANGARGQPEEAVRSVSRGGPLLEDWGISPVNASRDIRATPLGRGSDIGFSGVGSRK